MFRMFLLLFFISFLQQCGGKSKNDVPSSFDTLENSIESGADDKIATPSFLNNIQINTQKGLVISSAYLTNEAGNLINPSNLVQEGEAVYLNLGIKNRWTVQNGRIAIGASQTITTNEDEVVVTSGDLFAGTQSLPPSEGRQLQLKAVVTKTRSRIPYYIIRFRIWDKYGTGEVTGSYRLRVKVKQQ